MRVIKFSLDIGWNMIETEYLIEPLWMEYQNKQFVVWCKEYQTIKQDRPLELYLATTGEVVQDGLHYVGTATTPDRQFVVHLFRE